MHSKQITCFFARTLDCPPFGVAGAAAGEWASISKNTQKYLFYCNYLPSTSPPPAAIIVIHIRHTIYAVLQIETEPANFSSHEVSSSIIYFPATFPRCTRFYRRPNKFTVIRSIQVARRKTTGGNRLIEFSLLLLRRPTLPSRRWCGLRDFCVTEQVIWTEIWLSGDHLQAALATYPHPKTLIFCTIHSITANF